MKKKDMKNKSFLMISVIMEQTEAKEQEVVQLPDEPSMDDSSSSTEKFENKDNWPDVEELVNQRGDETTVYLLADGRYMDRINAVYIYDGKLLNKIGMRIILW